MFSLIRGLIFLAVCLVGIGLWRGWFSMSKPVEQVPGEKLNISVSIDTTKLKADAKKVRQQIADKVGPKVRELEDKAKAEQAK